MGGWYTNPVVWIGAITALVIIGRVIFLIGQWKGKVDEAQSAFKTTLASFMEEIRAEAGRVHARIDDIFGRLPRAEITSGSPLTLTDLGRRISDCLNAKALAGTLADSLRERVRGRKPYQIHEMCFDYVKNDFDPPVEVVDAIGECAYEHGVKREQVLNVLAVELRDQLLSALDAPGSETAAQNN
jgi:hypothetical protein